MVVSRQQHKHKSRRIFIVGSVTEKQLVKTATDGDSLCFGDLLHVWISDNAIIICSYGF
jgi:hypothetical protein